MNERHALRARLACVIHAMETAPSGVAIAEECLALAEMLLAKNTKYGDSALRPARIFSRAPQDEQIRVRIDDKIQRIQNQQDDEDEDVVADLLGYLILLRIAMRRKSAETNRLVSELAFGGALPPSPVEHSSVSAPQQRCQECGIVVASPSKAICDKCYQRRFGRQQIDLSHVQG